MQFEDTFLANLAKLEAWMPYEVPTKPVQVTFILSVMEVEAWFIAEHTHFERINPALTVGAIQSALNFDPSTDDIGLRPTPAADLHACYALSGNGYDKFNTQPTIEAIDYVAVYVDTAGRFSYLEMLCGKIETFLGS